MSRSVAHFSRTSSGITVKRSGVRQVGCADIVGNPIPELLRLAVVPVLHGAVITGNPAVDLGTLATERADGLLAGEVTVGPADGVGRGEGVIRQTVVLGDLPHQVCGSLPVWQLLAEECVEDGAGGVEGLHLVLDIEGRENVFGEAHGQVGGVGVVRSATGFGGGDDVGIPLFVVFGEAESRGFRGRRFEIIQVTVLLLIDGEAVAHMIQHLNGEILCLFMGQIGAEPGGV